MRVCQPRYERSACDRIFIGTALGNKVHSLCLFACHEKKVPPTLIFVQHVAARSFTSSPTTRDSLGVVNGPRHLHWASIDDVLLAFSIKRNLLGRNPGVSCADSSDNL